MAFMGALQPSWPKLVARTAWQLATCVPTATSRKKAEELDSDRVARSFGIESESPLPKSRDGAEHSSTDMLLREVTTTTTGDSKQIEAENDLSCEEGHDLSRHAAPDELKHSVMEERCGVWELETPTIIHHSFSPRNHHPAAHASRGLSI